MPPKNILLWKNKIWESRVSNSGDLAIIQATFTKLRELLPEAKLHMLSDDPEYARERYGVTAHPIGLLRRPLALLRLLRSMDLVILGGGTVLQDDYFVGVIPINLSVPLLCKALGAKLAGSAIGVGSDEEMSPLGRALCRISLGRFDSISVRDEESKRLVERWVKGRVPVIVTNDIAADLPSAPISSLSECLQQEGVRLGQKPAIVIAARKIFHHELSWLYFLPSSLRTRLRLQPMLQRRRIEEFKRTLAQLCDHLVRTYDADVVLLPFYSSGGTKDSAERSTPVRLFSSGDNEFARAVRALTAEQERIRVLERSYLPEEMLAIIGRADALVGVPYHSVVFAASQHVPMLGVSYVSKIERYMRILGLERFVVPATLEQGLPFELLRDKFDELWRERHAVRAQLAAKNPELARLARRNVELLRELLG